jgi:hypothetical protein
MLAFIILGKESCTSSIVDVNLQPFIGKLSVLWKDIDVLDAYTSGKFNFKAMCMWSINDFSIYDLFIGCVTKGHPTCPPLLETKENGVL